MSAPRSEIDRRLPLGRALLAQAGLELRLLLRSGESLIVTLGIPLGILVFLSSVDVVPTGDGPAVDFLVPGVLAVATAATGLVAVAIQTAFERKYGVLKRLGGTPLPRAGFLVAKALAVAAVLAVQTGLTFGLALGVLGWSPGGGLLVALPIVVVGAVAMTALGLAMAGALRAEATLAVSNAVFLVLLLVSGVTFDPAVLPDGVAAIGRLLPVGAMGEALRAAFAGASPWADLGVLAAWGVAAVGLAARTFRWEP